FDKHESAWRQLPFPYDNVSFRTERSPGRQRRPAYVPFPFAPGHPRRGPLRVRHPNPAVVRIVNPAPVVIRGPGPLFVADPIPTAVGPQPVSFAIGTPIGGHVRGMPAASVTRPVNPATA